jgi:ADP-ribosylglycohydrolase
VGCLLGGAVGDALGAPLEFMKRSDILHRFGPAGLTNYALAYGGLGRITDDTQMTLFTTEGLIRAQIRLYLKGITTYSGVTAHAYLRWLRTQGEQSSCDADFGDEETGWLFGHQELHNCRAPGVTCMSALKQMKSLGDQATNDSKGCGSVMRVAPVGLFGSRVSASAADTFDLGAEIGGLTHGHPTGKLSAGAFAMLIQLLVDGVSLTEALADTKKVLKGKRRHAETLRALERAEELAACDKARADAIAELGEGWVAEEALAISVYCGLVANSLEDGIVLSVNHDGDSDSTGAITGNLLGATWGATPIPEKWLLPLELREVITEMAVDLYEFPSWDLEKDGDALWKKYPGF